MRYPGPTDRTVYLRSGAAAAAGLSAVFYAAASGSTLADVQYADGSAMPGATAEVDEYSRIPELLFPDGVKKIFVSVNSGPRTPLYAITADEDAASLAALSASVATNTTAIATLQVGAYVRPGIAESGSMPAPIALMVTSFQSGHGYTNNAGGSANLNDTSQYVLGSQSVSAVTDGAATAKTIKRTGMTAFSAANRHPVVWVKCDDSTKLAGLKLYLGDTNLANSFQWEMKSSAGQKWLTDGDWHRIDLSWGEVITSGSPNRAVITDAQIRIVDDGTGPVTVRMNGIGLAADTTTWPNGVVSLTFDDTYASHYTEARKKMDQYGFGGTAYVIQEYFGAAGRLTIAQAQEMQRFSGWEIAGHATTGAVHSARMTSLSASQLATEFAAQRAFMDTYGFTGDHSAYPGGEFNNTVLDAAERFFTGARTTFQRPEVLPPPRRSKLRCGGYVTSATLTATLTAAVDQAYTNKEWLIFGFHDIVTTPSASTDFSIANFATVIDYLATKGIPVRTVGDVLRVKP